mgnify:CR=1 FL=1
MIACIGAAHVSEGDRGPRGVRCRRYVEEFGDTCQDHAGLKPAEVVNLLQPDVILLKINVNPRWKEQFMRAGVPVRVKTRERELQVREKHIEEAKEFGRIGFPYRTDVPDSGTAIFGKDGAKDVEVVHLLTDLLKAGYKLAEVAIEERELKHLPVLIVSFRKETGNRIPEDVINTLVEFLGGSWEFVHIYANPYRPDGTIVHTVNAAHRRPEFTAKHMLVFADGLWDVR